VLSGGEKLADLYYAGTLSFLNHAEVREWPEPTVADVHFMQQQMYPEKPIDDTDARALLEISGGHSRLLQECLRLRCEGLESRDCYTALLEYPLIWQLFLRFANNSALCEYLKDMDLGPYQPYLLNPLLRSLYWKNLVAKRKVYDKWRLVWRCDLFRRVGQEILNCND
jgi:hypothetical protein